MWRLYAPTNRLGGVNDDGALVAPTTVKAAEDTRAPTRGAYIFYILPSGRSGACGATYCLWLLMGKQCACGATQG